MEEEHPQAKANVIDYPMVIIMEKQRNKLKKGLIAMIAIIIIISNTPPIQYFLLEQYSYQNGDATFTYQEIPGQALDFEICQIRWARFVENNPNANHTLYRNFSIRPWQFWAWWQFIAHGERYRLPYLPKS